MEVLSFEDIAKDEKKLKNARKIAIFGKKSLKNLFKDYLLKRIDDTTFLGILNAINGADKKNSLAMQRIAQFCYRTGAVPIIIDVDIDDVLNSIKDEIKYENKDKLLQEARIWYISKEGPYARLYHAFYMPFSWLPSQVAHKIAKFLLAFYAFFVNIIPGDQYDVSVAISLADEEIADRIAKEAKKYNADLIIVPESIKYEVISKVLELKDV